MPYDINSIRRTTAEGIPDLADKIFAGIVNEEEAINALFMGLRPKLTRELEKRKADEVLWIAASESKELKNLKDYVETYDNEAPEYIGRHIDEANSLISLIENDDAEWYYARSKDSISAYRHYLDRYDNPAPSYRGKYIDQVNEAIKVVKDRDDWTKAKESNSIRSYSEYLSIYDKEAPAYIGRFVNEAKKAIFSLEDDAAWQLATNLNTLESYQAYLSKYDNALSTYRGKYVESAKQKIEKLLPPPPDPGIEDGNAWKEVTRINSLEGYRHYLSLYKNHANEAELAIRHLIDEKAWKEAKDDGTIASYKNYLSICKANEYPGYEWAHINAAKTQIGNLRKAEEANRKEEERKRRITEDNVAWEKARKDNTRHSYEEYLTKYKKAGGLHIREAEIAILKIQSDEDWEKACAENTLSAYKKFVDKYEPMSNKYMSMHLPKAKKKVEELSPIPHTEPIKWKKWLFFVLVLALCWFLWIQWQDNAWPFNICQDDSDDPNEMQDTTVVEEVDSLQWAIDNHNIPMLEKYANLDSVRAYFPLANELFAIGNDDYDTFGKWVIKSFNSPDSIQGRKLWNCYALPIVDGLTKSVNDCFDVIDWSNSDYAEKRCLDIYSSYVTNIESSLKLLQQPQRISSLESKVKDYLTSWERVMSNGNRLSSEGKSRYDEWRKLKTRLDSAVNNKEELIRTNYFKMKYDEK